MAMTCDDIRRHLARWVQSAPSDDERTAARTHAAACLPCRALLRAWFGLDVIDDAAHGADLDADADTGLVASVMRTTTGSACERATDLLAARADGEPDGFDARLLARHLDRCVSCTAVARALAHLDADLAGLREIDPGAGFTAEVVRRTRASAAWRRARASATTTWERWWRRPRFAWESAYVGAIAFWLLVGTPVAAFRALPSSLSGAVSRPEAQSALRQLPVDELGDDLKALTVGAVDAARSSVRRTTEAVEREVDARYRRATPALRQVADHTDELGRAVRTRDWSAGMRSIAGMTSDAFTAARTFVAEPDEATRPDEPTNTIPAEGNDRDFSGDEE